MKAFYLLSLSLSHSICNEIGKRNNGNCWQTPQLCLSIVFKTNVIRADNTYIIYVHYILHEIVKEEFCLFSSRAKMLALLKMKCEWYTMNGVHSLDYYYFHDGDKLYSTIQRL